MTRKVEDAFFICMKQFAKIKLQFADFATWYGRNHKSAVKTEYHSVLTAIILMLMGYFSKIEVIK